MKNNWRDTLIITADRTLTESDVTSLKVGDYLTPIVTGFDPEDKEKTEPLFVQGEAYAILEVRPPGIVLDSAKGNWWLDFSEGYGQFFTLKQLSKDEELGKLEAIPYEIMKILAEYGEVPRTRIVAAIIQANYVTDPGEAKKLRADVSLSIRLLLDSGIIRRGEKVGMYSLTPEGLKDMWEGSETNKEKWESGKF